MKTLVLTLATLPLLISGHGFAASAEDKLQSCGPAEVTLDTLPEETCDKVTALIGELKRKPEKKINVARQRADADADKIRTLLISEGYYAASVDSEVSGEEGFSPLFHLSPGKRFTISSYTLHHEEEENPDLPKTAKELGIPKRANPEGKAIVAVETAILAHHQNSGHPEARLLAREILANFESQTAKVELTYSLGKACTYGSTSVEGLERLNPDFVTELITFKSAKPCSLQEMEEERVKLGRTGLFAATEIKADFSGKPEDATPIKIRVKEAKARTVGAGLSFATNRGAGGHIFWEHRNLAGRAENLRAEIKIEEIKQEGTLSFRKPIPSRGATLFASLGAKTEALDAYDAQRYTFKIGTDFPLAGLWKLSESIEYEYADVEEAGTHETGHSVLVPFTLSQSTVENLLDTKDGVILSLTAAPAYSTFGEGSAFVKLDGRVAYHRPLGSSKKWDAAAWTHIGTLQGAATANISPTQLYYGGGSSSVRAIAWEHLGSLAPDNTPLGGRSLLEGGLELRYKVKKNWQLVTFVEGGRAFAARTPDFDEELLWGGGVGLRYHTAIGPLRLDIAAPFNPRETDDEVQFYIGLGQAF